MQGKGSWQYCVCAVRSLFCSIGGAIRNLQRVRLSSAREMGRVEHYRHNRNLLGVSNLCVSALGTQEGFGKDQLIFCVVLFRTFNIIRYSQVRKKDGRQEDRTWPRISQMTCGPRLLGFWVRKGGPGYQAPARLSTGSSSQYQGSEQQTC